MAKTYIGERYAPLLRGPWESNVPYERLTIVAYDDKGYISLQDVPVGTLPTDANYWMLLYNNTINLGSITWDELQGKPATFPPSAHTQAWSTITSKPTLFPPSDHTHSINQINGLPVTISDIQQDIEDLKNSSGGDVYITEFFSDSFSGAGIPTNNYTVKVYSNGYIEYDAQFYLSSVNLGTSVGQGYASNWVINDNNIGALPKAFSGRPSTSAEFKRLSSSLFPIWTTTEYSSVTTEKTRMPTVKLLSFVETNTTGTLSVSLKGF